MAKGVDKIEIIKVVKTTAILGEGTEKDPVRHIYQYWDFKGNLLANHDTLEDEIIID